MKIRDILSEFKDRPEKGENPEVLTLTEKNGFIRQSDRFNKRLATEDLSKYKLIHRDDFAFNPYLLWAGAIARNDKFDEGVISPLYPTFKANPEHDPAYIQYLLLSPQMLARYDTIAFGSVPRRRRSSVRDFLDLSIPDLPPLAEQQRIAKILDTSSSHLTSRRTQLERLSTLENNVFERFHSSHLNQATRYHLKDVVPSIDSGKSPVCESRPALDNECGVLKLSAVTTGEFLQDENKAYLKDTESFSHLEIQPGDLLMTRKNTPEHVGAVSLVRETRPHLLLPDLIFRLNLNRDLVEPEYIAALLMSPTVRFSVRSLAGGSAKSMSNISKQRLNELHIDLPPLVAQREFATKIQEIRTLKEQVNSAYKLDQELLASLQAHAFTRQL